MRRNTPRFESTFDKVEYDYNCPKGQEFNINTTLTKIPRSGKKFSHLRLATSVDEDALKGVIDRRDVEGLKIHRDILQDIVGFLNREIEVLEAQRSLEE